MCALLLGPRPLSVDAKAEPQKIVGQMIAFWRQEFAQVLPDRPDLIVVPEACDRPAGLPRDKLQEYYRVRKNQCATPSPKSRPRQSALRHPAVVSNRPTIHSDRRDPPLNPAVIPPVGQLDQAARLHSHTSSAALKSP